MASAVKSVCSSRGRLVAVVAVASLLGGCETIAITALGVGASAGVTHTANGVSFRTFTAPAHRVRTASLTALGRMGVKVDGIDRTGGGELIKGTYAERRIEVELEPMSKSTTQVRATAKRNFFVHDAATAREIVDQTARAMGLAPLRQEQAGAAVAATAL